MANLKDILVVLPVTRFIGPLDRVIDKVKSYQEEIEDGDIVWLSDKNKSFVSLIRDGVVICGHDADESKFNSRCTYLIVKNPRLYFLNLVKVFFTMPDLPSIAEASHIDKSVKVGKNVTIGTGVVVEANCVIGDYSVIDHNTVIKKGTVIGTRVKIGANNTIGGVGFGYEKSETGNYELIPHIGNVVIEDGVEIGNNTAIDRAVLGSTIIRKNAKIDNLVHIAHGVEIGENSLVIANSMIAGSTVIGKNVWVAPSASILNKLTVADNAFVGMGAVVLKDVSQGKVVIGNPAKELNKKLD
jgi:UDP-3-O-[3-hydroxymyristoyl] glucosamine N-acyltransferase